MTRPAKITFGQFGEPRLSRDGRTMIVSIPITLRKDGHHKRVITPANAAPWTPPPARVDNTMVKALVRAHRWRNMLDSNLFPSVRDLAKAEKINESYLCRVLRLSLLSPAIAEAILDGRQAEGLELSGLLMSFPVQWEQQDSFLTKQAR